MANKNNAKCSICGAEYYACLSCHDSMKLSPWKLHCCSASHYQVFQVVRGLSTGVYTEEEAKEKFKKIDLTDMDSFRPNIKKIVENVLKKKEKESVENIEETVEVETEKDIVVEDIIKTTYPRKRNFRQGVE